MKIRLLGVTVASAALVLAPVAAHAAGYAKLDAESSPGVHNSDNTAGTNPAIDELHVHGARNSSVFKIVVTYADLKRTPYTRYAAELVDPDSGHGRILEWRVGATTSNRATTFYYVDYSADPTSIEEYSCKGAKASPDYGKSTITFTIPVSCWSKSYYKYGAWADAFTAQYTAQSYPSGPYTDESYDVTPDQYDGTGDFWQWSEDPNPQSLRAAPHFRSHLGHWRG